MIEKKRNNKKSAEHCTHGVISSSYGFPLGSEKEYPRARVAQPACRNGAIVLTYEQS
jgi:hypothetical protein